MAFQTFEVTSYRVAMGYELTLGGGQYLFRSVISCHSKDGWRFIAYFQHDGATLYQPFTNIDAKFGRIFLHVSEFDAFVDMLRNEKPMFAYINDEKPGWNNLRTSAEPVGEEEN